MYTTTLPELLKKGIGYKWSTTYQKAFDHIKKLVCNNTTLCYLNVYKPAVIQVDVSKYGLSAALLLKGNL